MANEIHILIVDDNFINRQYFSMSLKKSGHQVVTVESGLEAIKESKKFNFNIILMDIRMSEMDGYETTGYIRQLDNHKETPILATSAENIPKEYRSRFNGFLLKPISPKQLAQIVEKYCYSKQSMVKVFNQDAALEYAYHDQEILNKLIAMFTKDLPIQMEYLESSIKARNPITCQDIIHKIRGSCKTCGAEALDSQLEVLARIIDNNDANYLTESMNKTKTIADNFMQLIKKL